MALSASVKAEKNKLFALQPWLVLLDVYEPGGTIYLVRNTENITYNGNVYTAFPFLIDLGGEFHSGEIPVITVKISNVSRIIQQYFEALNGGSGMRIVIHRVNAGLLAQDYSELDLNTKVQNVQFDLDWATIQLGMPNPLNQRFVLHRYLAEHCNWQFKGNECGYSGATAACDRTFDDCSLLNNTRRFGGFLGLSRSGVRFV